MNQAQLPSVELLRGCTEACVLILMEACKACTVSRGEMSWECHAHRQQDLHKYIIPELETPRAAISQKVKLPW